MSSKARELVIVLVIGALVGAGVYKVAATGKLSSVGTSLLQSSQQKEVVSTEENAVENAVAQSSPSVVAIGESQSLVNPFDPFAQPQQQQSTIGTGFVVSDKGIIVTNKHVVSDLGATYSVVTNGGKKLTIEKIYRDPIYDLAIIQVSGSNLKPLPLGDSSQLKVGQSVIAIGNALGQFSNTVTTGVVSGLGRSVNAGDPYSSQTETLDNLIQTSAAINPGNSGGPLLDLSGQVIGVNVATTQGAQNIGFAIPINQVKSLVDQFSRTGTVSHPFLGIEYTFIDTSQAMMYNLPEGAYIQQVVSGTPADQAGIKQGDVITKIDGKSVNSTNVISNEIQSKKVGDQVSLEVWSNGQTKDVNATLIQSPNQ